MKRSIIFFAVLSVGIGAEARAPKDDAFYRAAQSSSFHCELTSGTLSVANEYNSPKASGYGQELSSCLSDGREKLLAALKDIPSDQSHAALRDAAKKVYTSWGPYSEFLLRGVGSRDVERSPMVQTFKQDLASYRTEVELTD
ncbi:MULTISPECIES: hypothetical protein [unclassified Stenotrophomonas]|uniref:hypothetical protein n=1 Tax=unclassified Stenotrophomonas TaxID=196198 RepID=UPI002117A314|nr:MULTISPECIES: hypothetical protein [unclassified Stenotrophomonas]